MATKLPAAYSQNTWDREVNNEESETLPQADWHPTPLLEVLYHTTSQLTVHTTS